MTIAEKLVAIAENEQKVYDAGYTDGYENGYVPSQEKTIEITENGTAEVVPDYGRVLNKVTVNVDVASSGDEVPANAKFQVVSYTADGYPLEVNLCSEGDTTTPANGFTGLASGISAFWTKIEKVNLPSTVTVVGYKGFTGMAGLKEVTNWDNIEAVGVESFNSCSLEYINHLPPRLTEISQTAFARCSMPITELPKGITKIGSYAFQLAIRMNIKKLPDGLLTIEGGAFINNGSPTVSFSEIPASVKTIGAQAFRGACKGIVGSLTFKGTPESIAANAFEMGTNVTDVNVPWAEGAVAGAPWGMTKATIHYESEV